MCARSNEQVARNRQLKKGLLIAFEGIDGAGKTTQARLALRALEAQGYACVFLREPTDGLYGQRIRALARKGRFALTPMEEFELFIEDRKDDVRLNIAPALAQKKIVLIDRYYYSSIAYQGALGLEKNFIQRENEKVAPRPDMIFNLTMPVGLVRERICTNRKDRLTLFEDHEYLERVKANFDSMKDREIVPIDATESVEQIHTEIMKHLNELIRTTHIKKKRQAKEGL
jgi:dTMP kinase